MCHNLFISSLLCIRNEQKNYVCNEYAFFKPSPFANIYRAYYVYINKVESARHGRASGLGVTRTDALMPAGTRMYRSRPAAIPAVPAGFCEVLDRRSEWRRATGRREKRRPLDASGRCSAGRIEKAPHFGQS
jgi:hypothetical protein